MSLSACRTSSLPASDIHGTEPSRSLARESLPELARTRARAMTDLRPSEDEGATRSQAARIRATLVLPRTGQAGSKPRFKTEGFWLEEGVAAGPSCGVPPRCLSWPHRALGTRFFALPGSDPGRKRRDTPEEQAQPEPPPTHAPSLEPASSGTCGKKEEKRKSRGSGFSVPLSPYVISRIPLNSVGESSADATRPRSSLWARRTGAPFGFLKFLLPVIRDGLRLLGRTQAGALTDSLEGADGRSDLGQSCIRSAKEQGARRVGKGCETSSGHPEYERVLFGK